MPTALMRLIGSQLECVVQSMLKAGYSKTEIMKYLAEHFNGETFGTIIEKISQELMLTVLDLFM